MMKECVTQENDISTDQKHPNSPKFQGFHVAVKSTRSGLGQRKQPLMSKSEKRSFNKTPVECNDCGKCFLKRKYLKAHKDLNRCRFIADQEENPFKCNDCKATFLKMIYLVQHKRLKRCKISSNQALQDQSVRPMMTVYIKDENVDFLSTDQKYPYSADMQDSHAAVKLTPSGLGQKIQPLLSKREKLSLNNLPVKCNDCGKCFLKIKYLQAHKDLNRCRIVASQVEKPFTCSNCGSAFLKRKYLIQHKRFKRCKIPSNQTIQGAISEKQYSCNFCGKRFFYNKNLLRHQRLKKKTCSISSFQNNDKKPGLSEISVTNETQRHEKHTLNLLDQSHEGKNNAKISEVFLACETNKVLTSDSGREGHHSKTDTDGIPEGFEVATTAASGISNSTLCNEKELYMTAIPKDVLRDECTKVYSSVLTDQSDFCKVPRVGGKKVYKCHQCGIVFLYKTNLSRHHRLNRCISHISRKRYEFYRRQGKGVNEKPFKCHMCGTGYIYSKNLINHMKRKKCCTASAVIVNEQAEKSSLIDSIKVELGKIETECSITGNVCKGSSIISSQREKVQSFPVVSKEAKPKKLHNCNLCGLGFLYKTNLTRHHRLKRCKFVQEDQHKSDDKREEPHHCLVCGEGFSVRYDLKQHERESECNMPSMNTDSKGKHFEPEIQGNDTAEKGVKGSSDRVVADRQIISTEKKGECSKSDTIDCKDCGKRFLKRKYFKAHKDLNRCNKVPKQKRQQNLEKQNELLTTKKQGKLLKIRKQEEVKTTEDQWKLTPKQKNNESKLMTLDNQGELNAREMEGERIQMVKHSELLTMEKVGELLITDKKCEVLENMKDSELLTTEKQPECQIDEREEPYHCLVCGEGFSVRYDLEQHERESECNMPSRNTDSKGKHFEPEIQGNDTAEKGVKGSSDGVVEPQMISTEKKGECSKSDTIDCKDCGKRLLKRKYFKVHKDLNRCNKVTKQKFQKIMKQQYKFLTTKKQGRLLQIRKQKKAHVKTTEKQRKLMLKEKNNKSKLRTIDKQGESNSKEMEMVKQSESNSKEMEMVKQSESNSKEMEMVKQSELLTTKEVGELLITEKQCEVSKYKKDTELLGTETQDNLMSPKSHSELVLTSGEHSGIVNTVKKVESMKTIVDCGECGKQFLKRKYFNQHKALNRCKPFTLQQSQGKLLLSKKQSELLKVKSSDKACGNHFVKRKYLTQYKALSCKKVTKQKCKIMMGKQGELLTLKKRVELLKRRKLKEVETTEKQEELLTKEKKCKSKALTIEMQEEEEGKILTAAEVDDVLIAKKQRVVLKDRMLPESLTTEKQEELTSRNHSEFLTVEDQDVIAMTVKQGELRKTIVDCSECGKQFLEKDFKQHKALNSCKTFEDEQFNLFLSEEQKEFLKLKSGDKGESVASDKIQLSHDATADEPEKLGEDELCEKRNYDRIGKSHTKESVTQEIPQNVDKEKKLLCHICGKGFFSKSNLNRHHRLISCKGSLGEGYPNVQVNMPKDASTYCSSCGVHFPTRKDLLQHKKQNRCKTDSSQISVAYSDGGAQFQSNKYLVQHKKRNRCKPNSNKGSVDCSDCGATFLKRKYLFQHKKFNRCKTVISPDIQEHKKLSECSSNPTISDTEDALPSIEITPYPGQKKLNEDSKSSLLNQDYREETNTPEIVGHKAEEIHNETVKEEWSDVYECDPFDDNHKEQLELLENLQCIVKEEEVEESESSFVDQDYEETNILDVVKEEPSYMYDYDSVESLNEKPNASEFLEDIKETASERLEVGLCGQYSKQTETEANELQVSVPIDLNREENGSWQNLLEEIGKGKLQSCDLCGLGFFSKSDFEEHHRKNDCGFMRRGDKIQSSSIKCAECGKQFLKLKYLKQHKSLKRCKALPYQMHGVQSDKQRGSIERNISEESNPALWDQNFRKSIQVPLQDNDQVQKAKNLVSSSQLQHIDPSLQESLENSKNVKSCRCNYCGKAFFSKSNRNKHLRLNRCRRRLFQGNQELSLLPEITVDTRNQNVSQCSSKQCKEKGDDQSQHRTPALPKVPRAATRERSHKYHAGALRFHHTKKLYKKQRERKCSFSVSRQNKQSFLSLADDDCPLGQVVPKPSDGQKKKSFSCQVCGKGFLYKKNIKRHIELNRCMYSLNKDSLEEFFPSSDQKIKRKSYKCHVCGIEFSLKCDYEKHSKESCNTSTTNSDPQPDQDTDIQIRTVYIKEGNDESNSDNGLQIDIASDNGDLDFDPLSSDSVSLAGNTSGTANESFVPFQNIRDESSLQKQGEKGQSPV